MKENLNKLKEITALQCSNGNWNFDPYMYGMANGMILAQSTIEGTEPKFLEAPEMWLGGYRREVLRTCPNINTDPMGTKLALGALGLAGETGEVIDLIKKHLFHGKDLDREKLLKELGDVRWYFEYLLHVCGFTLSEVEKANTEKLRKRFPDGFSCEAANAKADEAKPA